MSQEKVAEFIGERQRFLSKVERGERRIASVELKELADLYGKPLDFFVK